MRKVFVKTKNIKALVVLMEKLINRPLNAPGMGLIFGEPGLGKSKAILWWAMRNDAVIITAKNQMTVKWFLTELLHELGEAPMHYHNGNIFQQVVAKLTDKPRVLIVDEIDYLINHQRVVETLRDLHDKTGIPVLMVGMGSADKKLSRHKHLFDRVIESYKFQPFDFEDVKNIIQTICEVEVSDDAIEFIFKQTNRFRQLIKIISKIENTAEANGYKKITAKELML